MIYLDGEHVTLDTLVKVARQFETVALSDVAKGRVHYARHAVEKLVEKGEPVYGINTGFGHLSDVSINRCDISKLQRNLLKSHACTTGKPLSIEEVRAMMVLRINALIKGYSGIRLETIEQLITLLNKNIIPVVYEQGSLGASGDLAPLSHMSLPLLGLGEVWYKGKIVSSIKAFKQADITPLSRLEAKEGLCLINGTQAMTAIGALALYDAYRVFDLSIVGLCMSLEALEGIIDAFDERIHLVRPHLGQIEVAKRVREYVKGSTFITKQGEKRIQDAYSLRCAPQISGATKTALDFIKEQVEIEMNAVTDNPIVFPDSLEAISAGNFHGQPLALAFDYLKIAMSELANSSERRIERMVNPNLSNGLPPFLVQNPGLNSGFMIVQYSAASIVSENKALTHPNSVDSIPSSANQEDHVSMGTTSARYAKQIVHNVRRVVGMELFTAAQAIDLREDGRLGKMSDLAYHEIRRHIPFIQDDEVMYPYIKQIEDLMINDVLYQTLMKEDLK